MASPWRLILDRLSGHDDRSDAERAPQRAADEAPRRAPEEQVLAITQEPSPQRSVSVPEQEQEAPLADFDRMEHLGQRNELLHVRFGYMADRLEDLKTLTEDFSLLTKPIEEMATELPKAKARILEYEALLQREVQDNRSTKADLSELRDKHAGALDERLAAVNRSRALAEELERSDAAVADHRIRLAELETLVKTAERRAMNEVGNRERLEAEINALTSEVVEKDDNLQSLSQQVNRQAERAANLDRECQRLQKIVDSQVHQIVDIQGKHHELEKASFEQVHTIEDLRNRRESERAERQKAAHSQDLALSALSAEKASLLLKVDELSARLGATDQSVTQLRNLLSEREGALRAAEEQLRTHSKDRAAIERQHAALEQQMAERSAQLAELKGVSDDAAKRVEMLTKALSAKTAAHDAATEKAHARSLRIDDLTGRFEKERASFDSANRRLVEELENERAERTLAQGALKIARESRASLQRQNEALKRSNRAMRNAVADDGEREPSAIAEAYDVAERDEPGEASSNVKPFPPKLREQGDND